eukprot:s4583_g2.t1
MSVPIWAQPKRALEVAPPAPRGRPITAFSSASNPLRKGEGRESHPASDEGGSRSRHGSEGRVSRSHPRSEKEASQGRPRSDKDENLERPLKRSEAPERPEQDRRKLGKTSGFFALGAWAARMEIAEMLESGVPVAELLAEINSGREGDDPLTAASGPPEPKAPSKEESPPASLGKKPSSGSGKQDREKPGSEKPSSPKRSSSTHLTIGRSSEAPSWAKSHLVTSFTFGRKPAEPPPAPPRAPSVDSREGSAGVHSEGYEPSVADSTAVAMEEMFSSGVLGEFKKRAERPAHPGEQVQGKDPYIPRVLPTRARPLEMQKLEQYRVATRDLFEELVIIGVPMDLIADITSDGNTIDDAAFTLLTDPKSAGTGLRYARLVKRFITAYLNAKEAGVKLPVFGHEFMQSFVIGLIKEGAGFRTPQSFLYAVEFYSGIFGFDCPGAAHPRVRKLARDYQGKAPERNPAPHFEVSFLNYLEKVVLDESRDLQTRVACGKLRLCTQASIRHSDLAGTAMSDVEWCRLVGGSEVLGLRAKAAFTKSGPRPWAAALLGVVPANDAWLTSLVALLLKMHGPGWKEHTFVGCAANKAGGFDLRPPLIDEDIYTVKRALKSDADEGKPVPLSLQEIGALRWHSCKSTIPTYMTHFGVTTRTVRFQGAWRKSSQAMPDLYLRESQTIVMKGQMEVLDQIRRGAVVQSMVGQKLDHIPMRSEWSSVSKLEEDGKLPSSDPDFMRAMDAAVVCEEDQRSGRRDVRRSAAPSVLSLCSEFRGAGAGDEEELASTATAETDLMDQASAGAPPPEVVMTLNEMVMTDDSDDSDADPKQKDMDLFPYFIQLASGNGKVHKPRDLVEEIPACRSQGKRFSNLTLTEDWGSSYSLCTKCFGGVKGDPGCTLLCDYTETDAKSGDQVRCGRRCDAGAVVGHKRPDEEGGVDLRVVAAMADTKSSVAFARAAASFEVHESDFLVLSHDRVTNFEAMAYRFPSSGDFEEYLKRSMRTRAAYHGENSEIEVFQRPKILEWEDYKSTEDVGCLRKLWGLSMQAAKRQLERLAGDDGEAKSKVTLATA